MAARRHRLRYLQPGGGSAVEAGEKRGGGLELLAQSARKPLRFIPRKVRGLALGG